MVLVNKSIKDEVHALYLLHNSCFLVRVLPMAIQLSTSFNHTKYYVQLKSTPWELQS